MLDNLNFMIYAKKHSYLTFSGETTMNKVMLSKMIWIATNRHYGQFDKQGQPYICHVLKVRDLLDNHDEEIHCIAIGHDLLEDTFDNLDAGIEYLKSEGFSERIIKGIVALTKIKGEAYETYCERLKSNNDAIIVKMADLTHNTQINRLKGIESKDIDRTVRYYKLYLELKAILES